MVTKRVNIHIVFFLSSLRNPQNQTVLLVLTLYMDMNKYFQHFTYSSVYLSALHEYLKYNRYLLNIQCSLYSRFLWGALNWLLTVEGEFVFCAPMKNKQESNFFFLPV